VDVLDGEGRRRVDARDAQAVLEQRAGPMVEIFPAHAPDEEQSPAGADVVEQLLLHGRRTLLLQHHPAVGMLAHVQRLPLQVQRAERAMGQRQPTGDHIKQNHLALMCEGLGEGPGEGMVDLGHEIVEQEANGGDRPRPRQEKRLAIGGERRGELGITGVVRAQGAVFADGMPPIVTFDGAEDGIVFTVAKEVMVDPAHAGREAQAGVQVVERALRAAEILIAAGLELNREERLRLVLQGLGHLVDQQELVKIPLADEAGIRVGGADDARQAQHVNQLREADGEGLAAVGEAVDVDDGGHLHAVAAGLLPQPERVLAQIAPVETPVVFQHLAAKGRERRAEVFFEERRQIPGGIASRQVVAVGRGQVIRKAGERVRIEVYDIPHPLGHAHFIVQLNHQDFSAVRDLPWREHLEDGAVPPSHAGEKIGVLIAGEILRLMILSDESGLRGLLKDPRRDALVDGLSHDVGAGAGEDEKAHVGGQVEKAGQVPQRVAVAREIGQAGLRLMPQPGNVGRHGVEAGRLQQAEAVRPLVGRGAEVVKFAGVNEKRCVIQPELPILYIKLLHVHGSIL